MMFRNAKICDKVFNYTLQEWGIITDIDYKLSYPLEVQYEGITRTYTLEGKQYDGDKVPVLFWDEVKPITPPKKPLPKLKIDTKVLVWGNGDPEKHKRYFSHFTEDGIICCFLNGNTSWSAKERIASWDNWELAEES